MTRIVTGMIAALALACGGGETARPAPASPLADDVRPVVVVVESQPSVPLVPRCEASAARPVSSYQELRADPDATRTVEVRFDAAVGEWMPSPRLDMPLHHASRIEWIDEPAHDALADARDRLLRISFVVVDRQLEQSRHEGVLIDATYRLRVVDVCEVPESEASEGSRPRASARRSRARRG